MGLTFVRASQQYAEASGGPLPGTISVFTIAVWCKPVDATDATSTAFSLGRSGATHYIALGKTSSGVVFLEVAEGGVSADAFAGTMSTGTWQHLAGVQAGATSRVAYLNGSAGTAETSNLTPNTLNVTTLAALVVAGSRVSFLGGDVAHAAVWSTALTAGEVASLAGGARPDTIQAASLVFYSEVDGVASPETDLVAGLDLVWGAGGAAPVKSADDPPVGAAEIDVTLTPATETDTAVALTHYKRLVLTPAAETDTAPGLVRVKAPVLIPAVEADSAVALVKPIRKTLTPATETDTAVALVKLGDVVRCTYGGDDTAAWTYGGDDAPAWTYGG